MFPNQVVSPSSVHHDHNSKPNFWNPKPNVSQNPKTDVPGPVVSLFGSIWTHDISMTSVASALAQGVTTSSTDFSFQNLVFWNLF
jgi:hypothetical protein